MLHHKGGGPGVLLVRSIDLGTNGGEVMALSATLAASGCDDLLLSRTWKAQFLVVSINPLVKHSVWWLL